MDDFMSIGKLQRNVFHIFLGIQNSLDFLADMRKGLDQMLWERRKGVERPSVSNQRDISIQVVLLLGEAVGHAKIMIY